MAMLREGDRSVTEICLGVGFTSLGTFSRTFREVVGMTPSDYRSPSRSLERAGVPSCFEMAWDRPSSTFGEDNAGKRS